MQAQIYKADGRGCSESEIFRRLMTFNFGEYQSDARVPFGLVRALNDETLAAGHTIFRQIDTPADVLILPLLGCVEFKDSFGNKRTIGTGQIGIFSGEKGHAYQLGNPYETELVNFLQIWIDGNQPFGTGSAVSDFELKRNELVPVFGRNILETHSQARGFIGLFDGRQEGHFRLQNPKNGLFAFVISGAFELENRLVESRDGLAISGIEIAGFEALSENAMLLVIEVPL